MNKGLRFSIAKIISKYYPYSAVEIDIELEGYKSIDLVVEGIENSLKYSISLARSCFELKNFYRR